jgi:hypothetical protein
VAGICAMQQPRLVTQQLLVLWASRSIWCLALQHLLAAHTGVKLAQLDRLCGSQAYSMMRMPAAGTAVVQLRCKGMHGHLPVHST